MAHPFLMKVKTVLSRFIDFETFDLGTVVIKGLESASSFIVGQSTNFFSGLAGFAFRSCCCWSRRTTFSRTARR